MGFFFLFLRDIHTFAHLSILSGCCYRYPRRAQWGGEGNSRGRMRRRSKWGGEPADEESGRRASEMHCGMINRLVLVVRLSKERMWMRWKEGKMTEEKPENRLPTCHQRLVVSRTHSSHQYLNLMSQASLNGSCILPTLSHSHWKSML